MKNLLVKETKSGIIADFKEGEGENLEKYKWVEENGEYYLEPTDRHYIRRWGRWWESYAEEDKG